MVAPLQLPDCSSRAQARTLSPAQRRHVIRVLASEGTAGLEAWLEEEAERDPDIRKRVDEERARLERAARAERERIQHEHDEATQGKRRHWRDRLAELRQREDEMREQLEAARSGTAPTVQELAQRSNLFKLAADSPRPGEDGQARKRTPWQRVRRFFRYLVAWLVTTWYRFIGWLTGRSRKRGPRAILELPDGVELDLPTLLMDNPDLLVEVRYRYKQDASLVQRIKGWWRRMLGREDYAELARKMMAEELARAKQDKKTQLAARAAALEEDLHELEEQELQAKGRRDRDLEDLSQRRDRRLEELARRVDEEPYEHLRDELLEELAEAGLVSESGRPTHRLLERLSNLFYEEALRGLPAGGQATPGRYVGGDGEYEKGPLRSLNEMGAMELVDSVVRARLNHPDVRHIYESDVLVHREVRTSTTHVVLIFDQSGSMEEKGRFDAAKRVCLVMYQAAKDQNPDARVDLLAMSTSIERVDLAGLWEAELKGFTNHGAALREARELLEVEGADRQLVYLITDGLPEAYTREADGVDVADRPSVCMPFAKEQARLLRERTSGRLLILQLETEDPLYLDAAQEIAKAAGGDVDALDPEELTERLLADIQFQAAPVAAETP